MKTTNLISCLIGLIFNILIFIIASIIKYNPLIVFFISQTILFILYKYFVFKSSKDFLTEIVMYFLLSIVNFINYAVLQILIGKILNLDNIITFFVAGGISIIMQFFFSQYLFKNKKIFAKEKIYPLLALFVVSLLSIITILIPGFNEGHDTIFHFGQIYDIYYGFKNGHFMCQENYIVISFLGYNTRIFYAPLTHLLVAYVGYIFSFIGLNLMISFKIVVIVFNFLSVYFVYKFLIYLNKSPKLAFFGSLFFLIFPYRIYNIMTRMALAEVFASVFIPLFFYGLVRICDEKKDGFLMVTTSSVLIILFHNITALFVAFFGLIYLLLNIKKIISLLNVRFIINGIICLFIIFSLTAFYYFGLIEHLLLNLYTISNDVAMTTSFYNILSQNILNVIANSGFFDFSKFDHFIYFGISVLISITFFIKSEKVYKDKTSSPKYKKVVFLIMIFILLFSFSINFLLAFLIYWFLRRNYAEPFECHYDKIVFRNFTILTVICTVMMVCSPIWFFLPKIFYKIQFLTRLYSFLSLFGIITVCFLMTKLKKAQFNYKIIKIVTLLVFISGSNITVLNQKKDNLWYLNIDESISLDVRSGGWQKEYTPYIYFDNVEYKSNYTNSLYDEVRYYLYNNTSSTIKDYVYIMPSILSGIGQITQVDHDITTHYLEVTIYEEALIQMPLFYYKGYKIEANNQTIPVEEVDGLVSFVLPKGKYSISVCYERSDLMNTSSIISVVGFSVLMIYGVYIIYQSNKKEI